MLAAGAWGRPEFEAETSKLEELVAEIRIWKAGATGGRVNRAAVKAGRVPFSHIFLVNLLS